jgi:CheY-like chemotaxis protein/integral membrane sensor domain MASE1
MKSGFADSLPKPNNFSWVLYLARVLVVAGAYYLSGQLGLSLPFVGKTVTLIWPPTGIALAALLVWDFHLWPGIFLGAFAVNATVSGSLPLAFLIAVGNTLAPVWATAFLKWVRFDTRFTGHRDVLAFVLLGGFVPMLISATCGTWSLVSQGVVTESRHILFAWVGWWLGDSLGVLIVGPLLLTARRLVAGLRQRRAVAGEFALANLGLLAAGLIAFDLPWDLGFSLLLAFLPFPFLIWVALRFAVWGASFTSFLLASLAIVNTSLDLGPFAQIEPQQSGMALLWCYVGFAACFSLLITGLTAERNRAWESLRASELCLREANQELERRVQERTILIDRVQERTAELQATNEELRRSDRVKSEFLARMSHELRNPLHKILALSESLAEQDHGPVNPRQQETLFALGNHGRHLLAMINDLLSQSKTIPHPVAALRPPNRPARDTNSQRLILLAEDNDMVASMTTQYLTAQGYRVAVACNGQEAIELFQKETPDLILMDPHMPVLTGLEAAERIRALPQGKTVPILALTGQAAAKDTEKCFKAGMNNYLVKPFSLSDLTHLLETYL